MATAESAALELLFNPIRSKYLILDVGANQGHDGLRIAVANRSAHVIAFEPVPEMIQRIHANFRALTEGPDGPISNYSLVQAAVADFEGKATFNVAGQADWGCSSLNTFADDLESTWPGRTDFRVTQQIRVQVIRLDRFLARVPLEVISYLHCDTQGSDIAVLRGLGEYRENLVEGVIECATSRTVALYKEQHLLEDACFEFARWGYEIRRITANDEYLNEVNVHFRNRFPRTRGGRLVEPLN